MFDWLGKNTLRHPVHLHWYPSLLPIHDSTAIFRLSHSSDIRRWAGGGGGLRKRNPSGTAVLRVTAIKLHNSHHIYFANNFSRTRRSPLPSSTEGGLKRGREICKQGACWDSGDCYERKAVSRLRAHRRTANAIKKQQPPHKDAQGTHTYTCPAKAQEQISLLWWPTGNGHTAWGGSSGNWAPYL